MMLVFILLNLAFAHNEMLSVEMSKKDLRVFESVVQKSQKKGYLDQTNNLWRKALLKKDGQTLLIKIKLKGDLPKHWIAKDKSWAVKITQGAYLDITSFDLSLAADKFFSIPLLVEKIYQSFNLSYPQQNLMKVKVFPNLLPALYVLEENLNEGFREKNKLARGDFYRPNNQWVLGLRNPKHPYATHFSKAQENFHPFFFDCIYFKPTLFDEISEDFCHFLALQKTQPQESFRQYVDTKRFILWLAIMAYLGDSHSSLIDNHSWYFEAFSKKASIYPRDFIPLYPKFNNFEDYLENLKKRAPLIRVVLETKDLRLEFFKTLQQMLMNSSTDLEFLRHSMKDQKITAKEEQVWSQTLSDLRKWHEELKKHSEMKK